MNKKYYITEVDKNPTSIYCFHGYMGESYIPEHTHEKAQFLYTEGGIVFVKANDKTYFLPARHYMWIPPGMRHSIHPSSEKAIMRNLYFPIEESKKSGGKSFYEEISIYPVNDLVMNLIEYSKIWKGDIPQETDNYAIANAFMILLEQTSKFSLPLALPYPADERLQKIVQYISENISNKVTLPHLAEHFNISIRSLTRLFSKQLNMSFIEYFTILKMLTALELLIDSDKSIKEICQIVGYSSVPTFSNIFYKRIGIRPAEYKKMKTVLGK